jgi:hypothetical protein
VINFIHAILMLIWVCSIPFLFWYKHIIISKISAIYSIVFIIVNRLSYYILGECILTTLARHFSNSQDHKWFLVKFSTLIFNFIPNNKQIVFVGELFIFLVALDVLIFISKRNKK